MSTAAAAAASLRVQEEGSSTPQALPDELDRMPGTASSGHAQPIDLNAALPTAPAAVEATISGTKRARSKVTGPDDSTHASSDVPYRKAPISRKKANEEARRIAEGLENGTLLNVYPALLNGITEEDGSKVRMSNVITHTPSQVHVAKDGETVTNAKVITGAHPPGHPFFPDAA